MFTGNVIFALVLLQTTFAPAQGFFNFMVYIHPHIKRARRDYPEIKFIQALLKAIKSKGEERPRRRSLVDKLRNPNYNNNRFTARELHNQQSIRAAALIIQQEEEVAVESFPPWFVFTVF